MSDPDGVEYVERLFLSNSKDLVRLQAKFSLVKFMPQLRGCKFVERVTRAIESGDEFAMSVRELQSLSKGSKAGANQKLTRKILKWQQERLRRVQTVFDEYNLQGWNQQETLRNMNSSINDDESDTGLIANQVAQFKLDYKQEAIFAQDIILPPFKEADDLEEIR